MTECHYTPKEAREVDLPSLFRLFDFWAEHPPPGMMMRVLAMMWGWKPPEEEVKELNPGSFKEALAALGDTFKSPRRFFGPNRGGTPVMRNGR